MLYNNKRRQQENYTENVYISRMHVASGMELHSSPRALFKGLKLPLGVEILKSEMEKS